MTPPDPPAGARAGGTALWHSVLPRWNLTEAELVILRRAVRAVDTCDQLQATVDLEGMIIVNEKGRQLAHPALVELRAQSSALARLIVALRLPDDAKAASRRAQRRAIRGYN